MQCVHDETNTCVIFFQGTDAGHAVPAVLQTINSAPITASSKPTTLDEGTYLLVYTATDSAGNEGSCTMQIEAKGQNLLNRNYSAIFRFKY